MIYFSTWCKIKILDTLSAATPNPRIYAIFLLPGVKVSTKYHFCSKPNTRIYDIFFLPGVKLKSLLPFLQQHPTQGYMLYFYYLVLKSVLDTISAVKTLL